MAHRCRSVSVFLESCCRCAASEGGGVSYTVSAAVFAVSLYSTSNKPNDVRLNKKQMLKRTLRKGVPQPNLFGFRVLQGQQCGRSVQILVQTSDGRWFGSSGIHLIKLEMVGRWKNSGS